MPVENGRRKRFVLCAGLFSAAGVDLALTDISFVKVATSSPIPTLPHCGLLALPLLIAGLGCVALRRRAAR